MIHPQPFPPLPNDAIASYDWQDLAEGTGNIKYYFFKSQDTSAEDEHIGTEELYSSSITTNGATGTDFDLDFDLSAYNSSRTLRGTAIFQGTLRLYGGAGGSTGYLNVKIRKVSGTETEIASGQSQTVTCGASGYDWRIVCVPIVIPQTHFKKGDTLRITVIGHVEGSEAAESWFGHDPQNRDGAANTIIPSVDSPPSINKSFIVIPYSIEDR